MKGLQTKNIFRFLQVGLLFFIFGFSFARELPHFMVAAGVSCERIDDPIRQRQELLRVFTQTRFMWPTGELGWVSVPNIVGQGVWLDAVAHKKGFKLYLRDYNYTGSEYLYYDARGIHKLSENDIETLKNHIVSQVESAASFLWEITKNLAEKINSLEHAEVSYLLSLPKIYGPESFVPDEIYLGPISSWGAVYLGLYGGYTRRVFLHPEALIYGCIIGKPTVLAHEMAHAQPTMQYLPLAWYVDVEVLTELLSGLWEDYFWELTHPYLLVINDLIEAYFGYSYKKSGGSSNFRSESLCLVWPNESRANNHQKIWEKIAPEIRNWVVNGLLPDFYEDPLFAMATNMKYCWDSAFMVASWSRWFELAGFGGYEATQAWLAKNEEIINRTWELAKDDIGLPLPNVETETKNTLYSERDFCPQPFSFSMIQNNPKIKFLVGKIQEDYKNYGREYVVFKLLRGGYR